MLLLTTLGQAQSATLDALSFDEPQHWLPRQASGDAHSEGSGSLALSVTGWTDLVSVPLESLGEVGSAVRLDLQAPTTPTWGEARLILVLPSAHEYWRDLGGVSLVGTAPGAFSTLSWPVPSDLGTKLSGPYSDLRLHVIINAPSGTYLLDDLRFDSPGAPPPPGPVEIPFELELALPDGVSLDRLAIAGVEGVRVNDRAVVRLLDGREPIIALTREGEVNIGADAQAGTVFSAASVVLRNRASLRGGVFAAGTIDPSDAIVSGGLHPSTAVTFNDRVLSWTYAPSSEDANLEPEQSLYLEPGAYRNVSIKSRACLYLDTGTYFFESLSIEPEAFVHVGGSTDPTEILIRSAFAYKGQFVEPLTAARPGNVLVGFLGESAVFIDAPFRGTLLAPNAHVVVRGGTRHVGTFYGRTVEVHQGAVVDASFVARANEPGVATPEGLLLLDEITGGDGTRENPYLVMRDNPHLAGSFALREGESVSGNGSAVGPGVYRNEFHWNWQGPYQVFGVLRATSGYEIDPEFGTYISTAVMIPTAASDESVNYDTRVFTLEPERLYKLEASVVRTPNDIAAEVEYSQPIWVRLAPEVALGSKWLVDAIPSYIAPEAVANQTLMAEMVSVYDYQLLADSNSTFSMRAHPSPAKREAFGDHRGGSMVGPTARDLPPDDIWGQCRTLTDVGVPRLGAAMILGIIRSTNAQEAYAKCDGGGVYSDWGPLTVASADRIGEDDKVSFLGLAGHTDNPTLWFWPSCSNSAAKTYLGVQVHRQNWTPVTLAHELWHLVTGSANEGTAADEDVHDPGCSDWHCANVRAAWCPTSVGSNVAAVADWLDTPPWGACRLAGGAYTITTRRRCRAQLLGEPIATCPDPNNFLSCYGLVVPTDG